MLTKTQALRVIENVHSRAVLGPLGANILFEELTRLEWEYGQDQYGDVWVSGRYEIGVNENGSFTLYDSPREVNGAFGQFQDLSTAQAHAQAHNRNT